MKLIKGDTVKVVKGKDSGKSGKITKIFPKTGKVLVEGVNQYKRHMKARSQTQPSEIVTITKPLPVGNVAYVCASCHLQTRIGYQFDKETKFRICRKCKKQL